MDMHALLQEAVKQKASDVHLVKDSPPVFRIHGKLEEVSKTGLSAKDIEQCLEQITTEEQRTEFARNLELDFGYEYPDIGRVRANAAKQRGSASIVIRLIARNLPSLDQLGLPSAYKELILKPRGLVVVTGPTGSGKSTSLSAMINHLNATESRRVVTVEDPIEFVYTSNKCTITQRELGGDTKSFAAALRHVLRQDPDVILVGEMRDVETAAAALTIAETGHLVLTTGHAVSASQSTERIIDLFPPHERPLVQSRLASLLLGIFTQVLVPKIDGTGRVAAVEIMLATPAVKNSIREGKIYQIPNIIMTQGRVGMTLLDQALVSLYHKGQISRENVFAYCNDPEETTKLLNRNDAG
ncbi:MAG: type IV pilus twitching motility protein PilT [Dehalococcoidales bacterium]|nr:type IV pilus twitching motility protein PilT [Dehalococcoidales bacterium]